MSTTKTDKEPAKASAKEPTIQASVRDDGESIHLMEPMTLSFSNSHRGRLNDLVVELSGLSSGFQNSLPTGLREGLRDLVRSMNCYYSNLIEGHNSHPIDIERALNKDYSSDKKKRDLQLEARAHIQVQEWIDNGGLETQLNTREGILEVHRRFCNEVPEDLLWVENPDTGQKLKVVPGEFRKTDVKVGRHIPVSAGAVNRFMTRYEEAYSQLGISEQVLSAAAAHHRLLWIHPFLDGNGRVARLISYAILLQSLKSGGLWSIARGLARNMNDYKMHLVHCDTPRRGDLDGRGNLSEEALANFSYFFLRICIDQVRFMESLLSPARFRERVLQWTEMEIRKKNLPAKSGALLEPLLYRGEIARKEVPHIIDASERSARRLVSELIQKEFLFSSSTKGDLRLKLSAKNAASWLPGLFPEKPEA